MTLAEVYRYAEDHDISIHDFRFKKILAMSVPDHIAIDYTKISDERQEKNVLMHEISHNETGTFYGLQLPLESKERLEYRARKWAWLRLIPAEELKQAIAAGCTEVWDLAEYFDLPEEQVAEAVAYYQENGMMK